jgi:hypothetical protein
MYTDVLSVPDDQQVCRSVLDRQTGNGDLPQERW